MASQGKSKRLKHLKVVNRWCLDFYVAEALDAFRDDEYTLFSQIREHLQSLLEMPIEVHSSLTMKLLVMQFLSRIYDGDKLGTEFEAEGPVTPLESAMTVLEKICEEVELPQSDLERFHTSLREMVVIVCIKSKDFAKAKEMLQKHFPTRNKPKGKAKLLWDLVQRRCSSHPALEQPSYSQFRQNTLDFIERVYTMPQPFLSMVVEKRNGVVGEPKSRRRSRRREENGTQTENHTDHTPAETHQEQDTPEQSSSAPSPAPCGMLPLAVLRRVYEAQAHREGLTVPFSQLLEDVYQEAEQGRAQGAAQEEGLKQPRQQQEEGEGEEVGERQQVDKQPQQEMQEVKMQPQQQEVQEEQLQPQQQQEEQLQPQQQEEQLQQQEEKEVQSGEVAQEQNNVKENVPEKTAGGGEEVREAMANVEEMSEKEAQEEEEEEMEEETQTAKETQDDDGLHLYLSETPLEVTEMEVVVETQEEVVQSEEQEVEEEEEEKQEAQADREEDGSERSAPPPPLSPPLPPAPEEDTETQSPLETESHTETEGGKEQQDTQPDQEEEQQEESVLAKVGEKGVEDARGDSVVPAIIAPSPDPSENPFSQVESPSLLSPPPRITRSRHRGAPRAAHGDSGSPSPLDPHSAALEPQAPVERASGTLELRAPVERASGALEPQAPVERASGALEPPAPVERASGALEPRAPVERASGALEPPAPVERASGALEPQAPVEQASPLVNGCGLPSDATSLLRRRYCTVSVAQLIMLPDSQPESSAASQKSTDSDNKGTPAALGSPSAADDSQTDVTRSPPDSEEEDDDEPIIPRLASTPDRRRASRRRRDPLPDSLPERTDAPAPAPSPARRPRNPASATPSTKDSPTASRNARNRNLVSPPKSSSSVTRRPRESATPSKSGPSATPSKSGPSATPSKGGPGAKRQRDSLPVTSVRGSPGRAWHSNSSSGEDALNSPSSKKRLKGLTMRYSCNTPGPLANAPVAPKRVFRGRPGTFRHRKATGRASGSGPSSRSAPHLQEPSGEESQVDTWRVVRRWKEVTSRLVRRRGSDLEGKDSDAVVRWRVQHRLRDPYSFSDSSGRSSPPRPGSSRLGQAASATVRRSSPTHPGTTRHLGQAASATPRTSSPACLGTTHCLGQAASATPSRAPSSATNTNGKGSTVPTRATPRTTGRSVQLASALPSRSTAAALACARQLAFAIATSTSSESSEADGEGSGVAAWGPEVLASAIATSTSCESSEADGEGSGVGERGPAEAVGPSKQSTPSSRYHTGQSTGSAPSSCYHTGRSTDSAPSSSYHTCGSDTGRSRHSTTNGTATRATCFYRQLMDATATREEWSDEESIFGNSKKSEDSRSYSDNKRRRWAEDESRWIKEGVQRFGVGKWERIRAAYPFQGRTAVNIKDRWRTMQKNMDL
ncbi:hypothetical protein ACEWY4_027527 [Coilia grayii]|uniref:Telomeric repeat-binding factor 2 n=1 Tax=Coilia grayii TaxID=363190 RepID=A0ABD1IPD0_9TELE